ncbi:MAG TPA: isochorismatase family cysteine hydrolase [Candidatus Acidoferrales bacterium]|nr:isochorismatase family cysteine hydrolase [Candidatus Acidoferrales bacterium]
MNTGQTAKSREVFFWEVDTQRDFMLPSGKLYVKGAEERIPNMKKLVDAARAGRVLLISDACVHAPDDPEFKQFPPHCVIGTPGAEVLPELQAEKILRIENRQEAALPADPFDYQQILLEKQTLDVFDNPHTAELVERIAPSAPPQRGSEPEFFVFGVVTEYCVRFAAKGLLVRGRRVALVTDAIETLDPAAGLRTVDELEQLGARFVTTDEALSRLR